MRSYFSCYFHSAFFCFSDQRNAFFTRNMLQINPEIIFFANSISLLIQFISAFLGLELKPSLNETDPEFILPFFTNSWSSQCSKIVLLFLLADLSAFSKIFSSEITSPSSLNETTPFFESQIYIY